MNFFFGSTKDLPLLLRIPKSEKEFVCWVDFIYLFILKDFGFVVNFVKLSKSET